MILDVISNDQNHKNDTFLKKYSRKTFFINVMIVTKMLRVYISVMVPDKPIVTIIDRQPIETHIQPFISHHDPSPVVTLKVTKGYIHEFDEKRSFLASFLARDFRLRSK